MTFAWKMAASDESISIVRYKLVRKRGLTPDSQLYWCYWRISGMYPTISGYPLGNCSPTQSRVREVTTFIKSRPLEGEEKRAYESVNYIETTTSHSELPILFESNLTPVHLLTHFTISMVRRCGAICTYEGFSEGCSSNACSIF